MAKQHKTMRGRLVNMDQLKIQNESTIALGNMNVNAGGDQLGPGGVIVKTSSQRVKEQTALHTMVPDDLPVSAGTVALAKKTELDRVVSAQAIKDAEEKAAAEAIIAESEKPVVKKKSKAKPNLAASLAKETSVKQKAVKPTPASKKKSGVKRI